MKNLILFEIRKVAFYRTFWVLMSMFTLFFFLITFVATGVLDTFNVNGVSLDSSLFVGFPKVWNLLCWAGGYLAFSTFGLLIIILTCNEWEQRTFRQHVIDGLERWQLLGAKLMLSVFLTLYAFLVILALGLVFGEPVDSKPLFSNESYLFFFAFFLQLLRATP